MLITYYTVKDAGSHEVVIQKSKFIGHIKRVVTEEEAQVFIQDIKKQHHNATHNCSAYIIGDHDNIQKANDDGEPSGTAGVPMLDVLKKLKLKNTVVVITRYFGGIKLGAGGLIRAYSSVTSDTIKQIGMVECSLMQGFSLTIEYSLLGKLENFLHNSAYLLEDISYLEKVKLIVYASITETDDFIETIIDLTSNQVILEKTDTKYIESDRDYLQAE